MDPKQVFINHVGRLRSGWRVLLFAVIFFVLVILLGYLLRIATVVGHQLLPGFGLSSYLQNGAFRLLILIPALVAGFICARFLEGLPWRSLGLWFHSAWWRDLLVGSIIGIASLALAAGIATAGGGLSFTVSGRDALLQVAGTLVFSGLLFILAALAEEAMFRGYPLQTLTRAGFIGLGIVVTAIAFAATHLENPNLSQGLPYLNLLVAGVWLAVAYIRTRSLWFPLGIHWSWNWALGSLFGLPVSGITNLAPNPLLHGTDLGPAWLTGGSFGIEGGLACTISLIVSTIFIWRTRLVSATPEMKELTSEENPLEGVAQNLFPADPRAAASPPS